MLTRYLCLLTERWTLFIYVLRHLCERLAKDTARDIYIGSASAPSFITYNDVVKNAGDISIKS